MGYRRRKRLYLSKSLIIGLVSLALIIGGGVVGLRLWYSHNLQPVGTSTNISYYTVDSGSSVREIASGLRSHDLIRNSKVFETYVRSNGLNNSLQAGTYAIKPSMSVQEIVNEMVSGYIAKNLLTIVPGTTLADIKKAFAKAGYSQAEIDVAFKASTYTDVPLVKDLSAGATLEGYLYPDSFQKDSNTSAQTIVRESLTEMQKYMSNDMVASFGAQGLTPFQAVTLASIVEQESGDPTYQPTIAQVFLSRIKKGMMLQSNVTANYAADSAGVKRTTSINSPYNTYLRNGLPPGPIGNVTLAALQAVAHPASTNYLYFVADSNGKIHFAETAAEHEANIQQYCSTRCAQ